jgi:hypothetical protein
VKVDSSRLPPRLQRELKIKPTSGVQRLVTLAPALLGAILFVVFGIFLLAHVGRV